MNRALGVAGVALSVLVAGFWVGLSLAQSRALDPALVAPHIHAVALENERVRVLEVTDRNGETPPLHSHPDRVMVFLSPCAWLVPAGDDGTRMESYKFGEVLWAARETHGGQTSTVIQECRILEIELKASP